MLIYGDDENVHKVEEVNDRSSNGLSGGWSHDQLPLFSPEFSAILLPFLILKKCGLPYLEIHPGP